MATQVHNLPKVPVSPVAVTHLLSRHTRVELESFVSVAIDLLDVLDGDADDNDTGDAEDEALTGFATRYADKGPGCIASDSRDDQAYIEWQTMRGSQKGGPNIAGHEDDEEDNEDCGLDEGEPHFVASATAGPAVRLPTTTRSTTGARKSTTRSASRCTATCRCSRSFLPSITSSPTSACRLVSATCNRALLGRTFARPIRARSTLAGGCA